MQQLTVNGVTESLVLLRPTCFVVRVPLVEALAKRILTRVIGDRRDDPVLVSRIGSASNHGERPPCTTFNRVNECFQNVREHLQQPGYYREHTTQVTSNLVLTARPRWVQVAQTLTRPISPALRDPLSCAGPPFPPPPSRPP